MELAQFNAQSVKPLLAVFDELGPTVFLEVAERCAELNIVGPLLCWAFQHSDENSGTFRAKVLSADMQFFDQVNREAAFYECFPGNPKVGRIIPPPLPLPLPSTAADQSSSSTPAQPQLKQGETPAVTSRPWVPAEQKKQQHHPAPTHSSSNGSTSASTTSAAPARSKGQQPPVSLTYRQDDEELAEKAEAETEALRQRALKEVARLRANGLLPAEGTAEMGATSPFKQGEPHGHSHGHEHGHSHAAHAHDGSSSGSSSSGSSSSRNGYGPGYRVGVGVVMLAFVAAGVAIWLGKLGMLDVDMDWWLTGAR